MSKHIINLNVINEKGDHGMLNTGSGNRDKEKNKLEKEMIQKFKQHMVNRDFFARLKLIMYEIDKELQMTRNGGSVTDDYIAVHKNKGESCD